MDTASYFQKNTRLETPRLLLRKITPSDASDMYEYASRPDTSKFLLWSPHPYYSYTVELTRFLQKEYAEGRFFDFAIIFKENSKMIGTVGFTSCDEKNLCLEVGYVVNPEYWGRGIATEALEALINFAFCELGANRVEAKYMIGNESSRRVMEKCKMKYEGTLRQKLLVKGSLRDVGICSLLRDEYFEKERSNIYEDCNKKGLLERLFHKN